MTLNQFADNETAWSPDFNALANALAGEAILSGCAISKGTGDWDTDVTSGTIIVGNSEVSISSGTVTHTQPGNDADMDSGESRVDIVTVDSTDTLAIQEGTAASNPAAPSIPNGEVVLGFWVIANGDSTLADSDRFDVPALLANDSARYEDGGSHEIDAADLAGGQGSAGNLLQSDGSAASWGYPFAMRQDGNSPYTASESDGETTYTVSTARDFHMVFIDINKTSSTSSTYSIQIDGNTSGYNVIAEDGTATTGESDMFIAFPDANGSAQVLLFMTGKWRDQWECRRMWGRVGAGSRDVYAENGSISSSIDSINIDNGQNESTDYTVEVYGRDWR